MMARDDPILQVVQSRQVVTGIHQHRVILLVGNLESVLVE